MSTPRLLSFWGINGRLDVPRLCRQLEALQAAGFDGAIWQPRYYPGTPPYLSDGWLDAVSRTLLHARRLGMELWLEDECGWPSGMVGGRMFTEHPEFRQYYLELHDREPAEGALGRYRLHDGRTVWAVVQRGLLLDMLNPAAGATFVAMTHERYRTGLDAEAFAYLTGFFTDEPQIGAAAEHPTHPGGTVSWSPELPALYRQRYGDDLLPRLPQLFHPEGDDWRQTRVRFRELCADRFAEAYFAPLRAWCDRYGKVFSGHLKGEETPFFQIPFAGTGMGVYRAFSRPGIDALERYPGNSFFPRQVASAAWQFGDGRALVECFGGSGWSADPEHLVRYLLWLAGHGLTDFVLHQQLYEFDARTAVDWPPSLPMEMSWRAAFPTVLDAFRRQAAALPDVGQAELLIVTPKRGVMAEYAPDELLRTNIHNACYYPDTPASRQGMAFLELLRQVDALGVSYHLAEERLVEQEGVASEGRLRLGRMTYRLVLAPPACQWTAAGERLLADFAAAGGGLVPTPALLPAPTRERLPPPVSGAVVPITWQVAPPTANRLVLDWQLAGSVATASFATASTGDLTLAVLEPVAELTLNGQPLRQTGQEDHARLFALPAAGLTSANALAFTRTYGPEIPVLGYLEGAFLVHSATPWREGPGATLASLGPFRLESVAAVAAADLVAGGYPFTFAPVHLAATVSAPLGARSLALPTVQAAAAHAMLGAHDLGWAFGPEWRWALPDEVASTPLALRLRLVPSTFNSRGPHHHVDGDKEVVSPGQVTYEKNFADRPDAPACTRVAAWHTKPFGVAGQVRWA
jgi:hypothetical protein